MASQMVDKWALLKVGMRVVWKVDLRVDCSVVLRVVLMDDWSVDYWVHKLAG